MHSMVCWVAPIIDNKKGYYIKYHWGIMISMSLPSFVHLLVFFLFLSLTSCDPFSHLASNFYDTFVGMQVGVQRESSNQFCGENNLMCTNITTCYTAWCYLDNISMRQYDGILFHSQQEIFEFQQILCNTLLLGTSHVNHDQIYPFVFFLQVVEIILV